MPLLRRSSTRAPDATEPERKEKTENLSLVKPPVFVLAVALLLLLTARPAPAQQAGRERWVKVQSKNFLLIGNAAERELRRIITGLEQFREVCKRLPLAFEQPDSFVPATIIVFRDDLSYKPFAPLYRGQPGDVSGAFQPSAEVNYITLSADSSHVRNTTALAFHEYVHLLVKNSGAPIPLWLNEGLAEFYSTFELAGDERRVRLGQALKSRAQTLREGAWLSLSTLFKVDDQSPSYNEARGREIFYAESWAFVHYLLGAGAASRRPQLARYIALLAAGQPHENALREAFQTNPETLEKEFRQYVQQGRYAEQAVAFETPLEFDASVNVAPLAAAEVKFHLGDLLLRAGRVEEAEPYLLGALKLDEALAPAHASLGLLRLRQERFDEAVESLARGVALDARNYLAHYHYADALNRAFAASPASLASHYPPETLRLMRAELKLAIELAPRFVEAYRLLAYVNLVAGEQLEESEELLRQAIKLAPQRGELPFLLAQVHLRRNEFQPARQLLSTLLQTTDNPGLSAKAQAMFDGITAREEQARRLREAAEREELEEKAEAEVLPCDAPQPGPQKKTLRFDGEHICGLLVRVECDEESVLLVLEVSGGTLKLRNAALNRIYFVTYTSDVSGRMSCGLRGKPTPVLVTYRSATDASAQVDGEVLAVEFIPQEWMTQPAPATP